MKSDSVAMSDIRDTNRKIVLRTVWKLQPISRADLSRYTRINKASISSIVSGLIEEELLSEERSETTQVGRTPLFLTIENKGRAFLAVDVRPDTATLALYNLSGECFATSQLADAQLVQRPERLLPAIADALIELCGSSGVPTKEVLAIGMAVPGAVGPHEGTVLRAASLEWRSVDVKTPLVEPFPSDIRFVVDNSANLAFRAELFKGHSLHETFTGVYVDINESVETGIMLDGKIVGYQNVGSFGRMGLVAGNGTGITQWQDLVSIPALLESFRGRRKRRADPQSELLRLKEAYFKGDEAAARAIRDEAYWLALGITNIFLSLGLPAVILGGHIRAIWDLLQEAVFARCEEFTAGSFPSIYQIRLSSLTERETLEGAALAAIGTTIPLDLISMLTNKQKQIIESRIARP